MTAELDPQHESDTVALGIDPGARHFSAVGIDEYGRLTVFGVDDIDNLDHLLDALPPGIAIAIDAPAAPSTAPHRDDTRLSPKFLAARCAEIALGQRHGYWVPWVTPAAEPFPEWMKAGFELHRRCSERGFRVLEVFPNAAFRRLAGGGTTVPNKQTRTGILMRVELLRHAGVGERTLVLWSHDSLDAAVAAVIARQAVRQSAERVSCDHDGSAIWLPTV